MLETKQYRLERGLSLHKNAEGILTDGPDYTFLDGRPTPLLVSMYYSIYPRLCAHGTKVLTWMFYTKTYLGEFST